jgi:hypothetical protein
MLIEKEEGVVIKWTFYKLITIKYEGCKANTNKGYIIHGNYLEWNEKKMEYQAIVGGIGLNKNTQKLTFNKLKD